MKASETGIELIAKERQEQIGKHGYDILSDVKYHSNGELVRAACAIAYDSPGEKMPARIIAPDWAWNIREYKMGFLNERIERLKVAGALIAAEIDRLQAIEEKEAAV